MRWQNGKSFGSRGFPRYAYLPNNDRGRHVRTAQLHMWCLYLCCAMLMRVLAMALHLYVCPSVSVCVKVFSVERDSLLKLNYLHECHHQSLEVIFLWFVYAIVITCNCTIRRCNNIVQWSCATESRDKITGVMLSWVCGGQVLASDIHHRQIYYYGHQSLLGGRCSRYSCSTHFRIHRLPWPTTLTFNPQ